LEKNPMRQDAETMMWLVPTMLMASVGHSMQVANQSSSSSGPAALGYLLSDAVTGAAQLLRSAAESNQAPLVSASAWDWGMIVFAGVMVVASMLSAIVQSREESDPAGRPRPR
jgi:cytochrome bd-type quinol oxidase subunit 1